MMKKVLAILLFTLMCFAVMPAHQCFAATDTGKTDSAALESKKSKYTVKYDKSEKLNKCGQLEKKTPKKTGKSDGFGGGVIPDDVAISIYNTTREISNSVMLVSILGDTLMCHATHAGENRVEIFGVELFSYPNIPVWICGAVIYFFGFMMVLSICFYVVDISFKLGFAIVLMPIGIALWPFEKTKDKLTILISIFLKSAAIFAFLAITVAYTLGMVSASLGGLLEVFDAIAQNDTDFVSDKFSLSATSFLLVVFSLAYGMKLIGSAVTDYANRFFPDKAFGGQSPMHHLSTQAMDFAKQKVVQPVASLAHDIAKTQAGRLTEGAGNLLQGKYHENIRSGIRNIGVAIRNPKLAGEKLGIKAARSVTSAFGGLNKTANNLKYGIQMAASNVLVAGKENRADLKEKLRNERDAKNQRIDSKIDAAYQKAMAPVDQAIQRNQETWQARQDAKKQARQEKLQQWHQDHMERDKIYRGLNRAGQKLGKNIKYADRERQIATAIMEDRLDEIDATKENALIRTDKFDAGVDKLANTLKNGGKLTNWYRDKITGKLDRETNLLKKEQEDLINQVETGEFASVGGDQFFRAGIKYLRRNMKKARINAEYAIAKAPTQILSAITKIPTAARKGVFNALSGVTKAGAYVGASIPNAFIRGYYNTKRGALKLKRGIYKAPDALKGAWKIPGVILEKTGQTMQNNKPSKDDDDK